MAKLMDGKYLSDKINSNIKNEISNMDGNPHLVAIQVGKNSESELYIKHKSKKAKELGFIFTHLKFNEEITIEKLLSSINEMNLNDSVNGIMVQLPLPKHIDAKIISQSIAPWKDVDGFHPLNKGLLDIERAELIPPTAQGVIELLKEYNISIKGKIITIIGVGEIAGKPLSKIFINMGATVIMCNKHTPNVSLFTEISDIVVAAVGFKHLVKKNQIKKGSIIINIGVTKDEDGIHGDIDFDNMLGKVSYITPIIGGTGPMTVSILLRNTLLCFKIKQK